jgi:hypothetical protein
MARQDGTSQDGRTARLPDMIRAATGYGIDVSQFRDGLALGGSEGLSRYQTAQTSLKISVLSSWVAFGVQTLVGLILTLLIVGGLGKTGYGVWTLVGSIIGYYGLLDLGVIYAHT